MPLFRNAKLAINEKPAFWLMPESRVDALKKTTGAQVGSTFCCSCRERCQTFNRFAWSANSRPILLLMRVPNSIEM